MTYREPLPEGCPPEDSEEIAEPRVVYRLVRNNPPSDDDFRPVTECQARGVSVFASLNIAEDLSTRGSLQGRAVCQVILAPGAGRILPTGGRSHHTWWPLADYDILANCQVMTR